MHFACRNFQMSQKHSIVAQKSRYFILHDSLSHTPPFTGHFTFYNSKNNIDIDKIIENLEDKL